MIHIGLNIEKADISRALKWKLLGADRGKVLGADRHTYLTDGNVPVESATTEASSCKAATRTRAAFRQGRRDSKSTLGYRSAGPSSRSAGRRNRCRSKNANE